MGWNADGTFTRSYDWTDEAAAGNYISSTKFDTENDNFATGIQSCINKDGKNSPTVDLPMGGFKHTGVADGSARSHYISVGQVQDSSVMWGGTSGGTANAQTISLTPAITSYTTGMRIAFIAGATNTSTCTINVNSIGAKSIYLNGAALVKSEIVSGIVYILTYDGTRFQISSNVGGIPRGAQVARSTAQTVVSSATANLTFPTDIYDPDALHDTSSNTDRVYLPMVGLWLVTLYAEFDTPTQGYTKFMSIKTGGGTTFMRQGFGDDGEVAHQFSAVVYTANASDYVVAEFYNNDPSSVDIDSARLSVAFLR